MLSFSSIIQIKQVTRTKMIQNIKTEIPLNKNKLLFILLFSLLFLVNGLSFLLNPPLDSFPMVVFIIGLSSGVVFGFIAITTCHTLSNNKAALIIDEQGITDNSGSFSVGFIPWTDVQEIKISEGMNIKSLLLVVKNPQDYIGNSTSPLVNMNMQLHYKIYGSPISISTIALKTDFESLFSILTLQLQTTK